MEGARRGVQNSSLLKVRVPACSASVLSDLVWCRNSASQTVLAPPSLKGATGPGLRRRPTRHAVLVASRHRGPGRLFGNTIGRILPLLAPGRLVGASVFKGPILSTFVRIASRKKGARGLSSSRTNFPCLPANRSAHRTSSRSNAQM